MSQYGSYTQHIRATRKAARIKLIQSMIPNLIHTPRTMTIPQYARYESERNLKLLIRFWWLRFIPVSWLLNQIENFTTEFNKLFNPESQGDLYRQIDKLIFQNKLMIMQALSEAIHVHLVHKINLDITRAKCGMKPKPDETLADYIQQIKDVTGIEIKTLEDVAAFRDELERSTDKFEEMFAEKKTKNVEGTTIMQYYFICAMNADTNPDYSGMTLFELYELFQAGKQKQQVIADKLKANKK